MKNKVDFIAQHGGIKTEENKNLKKKNNPPTNPTQIFVNTNAQYYIKNLRLYNYLCTTNGEYVVDIKEQQRWIKINLHTS